MKVSKKKMAAALIAVLLGGLLIFGYFWWQDENYVSTIDARVDGVTVNITPYISGRLVSFLGEEGQAVTKGQNLGTVDGGTASAGVVAPISGTLVQVNVAEGQGVSQGTTMAVVADMENLFISANIEETVVDKLAVGQGVEIRLDAYPGEILFGRIDSIGHAATSVFSMISSGSSNGNYTKITQLVPVKIDFLGELDHALRLGLNAEIKIHIKTGVSENEK